MHDWRRSPPKKIQIHETFPWIIWMLLLRLVYAGHAMCCSLLDLHDRWSEQWGPLTFTETMSRNFINEILLFLSLYSKSTRSFEKNKFSLASELWSAKLSIIFSIIS